MRSLSSAEKKLATTLRYLATGESLNGLKYQFGIHETTISKFIAPVCEAIYKVLAPDYMKCPSIKEEWEYIIDQTKTRWQFPNCFAAADGKHIGIICPKESGSQFYNYKGFFSIALLAFVDYDYKFLIAEVGFQERISDGGVFRNSVFNFRLSINSLNLPNSKPLPASNDPFWLSTGEQKKIPMVFVADDAFPLTKHCMKPYDRKNLSDEERVFNYRCSRFRRISENGFGIWFRLFATRASLTPEKAEVDVMASLVLHNLLRAKSRERYTPIGSIDFQNETGEVIEGTWHQEVVCTNVADLQPSAPCRASMAAEEVRNEFKLYFNGPGQIPFQWRVLHK